MLAAMKYRDFVWPNNPRIFEVEYRRTLHSYKLPFSGYVVQDLGLQNKIIRGEGEFTGTGAYESFRQLAELFEENKGGKLVHPVWPTIYAYFAKLNLREEPREDYVHYSFEFWEYKGSKFEDVAEAMDNFDYDDPLASLPGLKRYTTAAEGDTLRSLAEKFGVSVEQMCSMNPSVEDPDEELTKGCREHPLRRPA